MFYKTSLIVFVINFGFIVGTATPGSDTAGTKSATLGTGLPTIEAGSVTPNTGSVTQGAGSVTPGTGFATQGAGSVTPNTGSVTQGAGSVTPGTGFVTAGSVTPGTAATLGSDSPTLGTGPASFGTGAPTFGTGSASFGTGAPTFGTDPASFGTGAPTFGTDAPTFGTGPASVNTGSPTLSTNGTPLQTTGTGAPQTPSNKQCPIGWYKESVNANKCIKFVSEIQPWFGSKFDCSTLGNNATLLSVDQSFENFEICQVGQASDDRCNQFYIGLFNGGNGWQWSNGDVSNYRNWKPGYPTTESNKSCVALDKTSCAWFNEDCNTPRCYVCQQYI